MKSASDQNDLTVGTEVSSPPARVLYVGDPTSDVFIGDHIENRDEIETVSVETNPREALNRLHDETYDCVVADYRIPDTDGIELFKKMREDFAELPFILVTERDNERVVSEAISAGITDYFEKSRNFDQYDLVVNRVSNAVDRYRAKRGIKQTQRQYSQLIKEATDIVTVIDKDGQFEYVSPAAKRELGYSATELLGEIAFEYIHPEDKAAAVEELATVIEQPTQRISIEFRFRQRDGSWRWIEARGRNLIDDPDIAGVVVYARDITERKQREQELHKSEQRFRSLFEKAFDAMVIADDDGRYTDANPAACDLFGLSREELIGRSIDEFSPDDFDFEVAWQEFQDSGLERGTFPLVSADGTERIVEFAATSNVIPGQHLSVLRDVTDREQHEQTLTALHHSSHELLSAESKLEVTQTIVETVQEVLPIDGVIIYLFDPVEGTLNPCAVSDEFVELDSLDSLIPTQNTILGSTYLDQTSHGSNNLNTADISVDVELPIQTGLFLPLGDHGVCLIGKTGSELTDNDRELAEILTAAAETALDRTTKEIELQERKNKLQSQNQRLEQLNTLNTIIREIDKKLIQAESRSDIETAICKHLSTFNGIAFTWFGEYDLQQQCLIPREWDGIDGKSQYLDTISLSADDTTEPALQATLSEEPIYVENVTNDLHEDPWRKTALSNGFRSVISIPITYKQISYGVITIYAERPNLFEELPRKVLMDLGNSLANAINAVEHQKAVLSETVSEITIQLTDNTFPLYAIASQVGCTLTLEGMAPQSDGDVVKYVSVENADPNIVTDVAAKLTTVSKTATVTDEEHSGVITVRLSGRSFTGSFADRGIRITDLIVDPESATVTLLVPDTVDDSWVFKELEKRYSNTQLLSKSQKQSRGSAQGAHDIERYRSRLTPRQEEVLQTAYLSGFFQSPRECTGEDLADLLNISPQTVYRHIRNAERKLFETVFEGG